MSLTLPQPKPAVPSWHFGHFADLVAMAVFLLCLRAAHTLGMVNSLWKLSHTGEKCRERWMSPQPLFLVCLSLGPGAAGAGGGNGDANLQPLTVVTPSMGMIRGHSWVCSLHPPCGDPSSLRELAQLSSAQLTKLGLFPFYLHTDIFTLLHWLPPRCHLSSIVLLIQVTALPWHGQQGGRGKESLQGERLVAPMGSCPGEGSSAPCAPAVAEPAACASRG